MCLQCHKGLSNDTIIKQIKESLSSYEHYDQWNPVSIHHLIIAAVGVNGPIAQKLSVKLLIKYYRWKKVNKSDGDGSFFGNPKAEDILELITKLHNYYKKNGYVTKPVCIESEYVQNLVHYMAGNIR